MDYFEMVNTWVKQMPKDYGRLLKDVKFTPTDNILNFTCPVIVNKNFEKISIEQKEDW